MRVLKFIVPLSVLITLLTYLINNNGQCCDQISQAGWPFPFYGGGGGFTGELKSHFNLVNFLLDLSFYLVMLFVATIVISRAKKQK
jgi:hypothetical protein